jgi:hypothetical protein
MATAAASAPAPAVQRPPTEAEIQSFNDFWQQRSAALAAQDPMAHPPLLLLPRISVQRQAGNVGNTGNQHGAAAKAGRGGGWSLWQLSASIDTKPRHAAVGVCHLLRSHFRYDGVPSAASAPKAARWVEDGDATEYVWPSGGPIPCTLPAPPVLPVQLSEPFSATLPAADVLRLLEQQATLLTRARLLFAGNTSCARQRALPFTLDAIASAPPQRGASAMYLLTFRSDRDTTARITIRKSGAELTAWDVSCSQ